MCMGYFRLTVQLNIKSKTVATFNIDDTWMILDFRLKVQADIKSKSVVTSRCTWVIFDL